ncbi:hypothetical protein MSAN_01175300 [Mycena sanguinolenta]|uniref:Uncharacterized protein n=1 Tax=Mycena sanguinolenta TaxID=230812 RepID=A0A8H7D6R2_9AGAR|nr:hypothetical protein MSAN_01175300 [Mycena sanguinolenta]
MSPSSSRKRKNRPGKSFLPYEAEIIRGPQAKQAVDSLDPTQYLLNPRDRAGPSGLIQWNSADTHTPAAFPSDADDFASNSRDKAANKPVWVDRYDARLLLESLPKLTSTFSPPSPTGWSDLPSDTEDTFFFSPPEADDYRQEKRRKLMDQAREERLKARRAEDGEPEEEDIWGGSDEEPDEAQRLLMERTAASVAAGRNPAQLEMRILANYGSDKRFAFLRGRWKHAWTAMKRKAEKDLEAKSAAPSGLGNLADYGDSDEDEDEAEAPQTELAARQARAKAWAESRRASKANT